MINPRRQIGRAHTKTSETFLMNLFSPSKLSCEDHLKTDLELKKEFSPNMGLKPITFTLKHTVYFHSIRLRLLRNHKFYLHAKVIGRCLKNFHFKDHLKRKRQSLQKVSTHTFHSLLTSLILF